ncbi:two-partner secretion domain-containing protein [Nostoc sp. WHI]|uniref:two-partner secretion domain-containing protein n=1 Tax=Nostoc sp. WHI TaxID=2650611 RepID=UPI0018C63814|nr:filamentous hemagglutinin N-terminal domain-containing protein [Nostoc sp. WHI]
MTQDLSLPNNTTIKTEGNIRTIEGGTQVGGNLFHSLKDFSVPTGTSAHFNNGLDIQNIITRITGGSVSNIDGLISTNGTANLFLINPSGIVFDPNARLDIGGSFFATTAEAIEFADGSEFSATNPQAPLLTVDIPIGLRFNGNSGSITVQGAGEGLLAASGRNTPIARNTETIGLEVQPGETLALIGSDITLQGGNITAEEGRVELSSIETGIVTLNPAFKGWILGYEKTSSFKDINLLQQSLVDSSGGFVVLQGKDISINDGSTVLNQNLGSQSWEGVTINASESFKMSGTSPDGRFVSLLRTESIGSGIGGNVNISTKQLVVEAGAQFGTRTYSAASGGNVTVNASQSIKLFDFSPSNPIFTSGIYTTSTSNTFGKSGDITVSTGSLEAKNGGLITSSTLGNGSGGNVIINAVDSIVLTNSVELINSGRSFIPSYLASESYTQGDAGNLTLNTLKLIIGERSFVNTSTLGSGSAGTVTINAPNIEISGSINSSASIAIQTAQRLFGSPPVPSGASGEVIINTEKLNIFNGGRISVRNQGSGDAGKININANNIEIANEGGVTATTAVGQGGDINLNSQNIQLNNGIISATAGTNGTNANGGNINIETGTLVSQRDSSITANAFEGRGGNIKIDSQGIFLSADSKREQCDFVR